MSECRLPSREAEETLSNNAVQSFLAIRIARLTYASVILDQRILITASCHVVAERLDSESDAAQARQKVEELFDFGFARAIERDCKGHLPDSLSSVLVDLKMPHVLL